MQKRKLNKKREWMKEHVVFFIFFHNFFFPQESTVKKVKNKVWTFLLEEIFLVYYFRHLLKPPGQTYRKKELFFIWRANKSDNIFGAEINHSDQIHHFQHRFDHLIVYERTFKKGRKVYDGSRSRANISISKHYWHNLFKKNKKRITFSLFIFIRHDFYLFIFKIFFFLEFW